MLTKKEQKKLAGLENDMKMPVLKYILIYGLTFGILLAIITAAIDVLAGGVSLSEVFRKRIWINLATAPIAGVLFGYMYRWLNIKEYHKLKAKELLP